MNLEDEDSGELFPSEAYVVKNTIDLDAVTDKLEAQKLDIEDACLVLSVPNADDLKAVTYLGEVFPITVIE